MPQRVTSTDSLIRRDKMTSEQNETLAFLQHRAHIKFKKHKKHRAEVIKTAAVLMTGIFIFSLAFGAANGSLNLDYVIGKFLIDFGLFLLLGVFSHISYLCSCRATQRHYGFQVSEIVRGTPASPNYVEPDAKK